MDANNIHACLEKLRHGSQDTKAAQIEGLKRSLQGGHDPGIINETISTLLDVLDEVDSGDHAETDAAFSALLTIMSNAKTKTLPEDTVRRLHKLLLQTTASNLSDNFHAVPRLKLFQLTLAKSSIYPSKNDLEQVVGRLSQALMAGARQSRARRIPTRHPDNAPTPAMGRTMPSHSSMGHFKPSASSMPARGPGRSVRRRDSSTSLRSGSSMTFLSSITSNGSISGGRNRGTSDHIAVRIEALHCLSALAKIDTKQMHAYLSLLFGPSATSTLLDLAEKDISEAVRLQALTTIKALLTGSKGYLELAQESESRTAFTSLSKTIADLANELNRRTVSFLRSGAMNDNTNVRLATLRLATTVVSVSPYDRLSPPHLNEMLEGALLLIRLDWWLEDQSVYDLQQLFEALGSAGANGKVHAWQPTTLSKLQHDIGFLREYNEGSSNIGPAELEQRWKLIAGMLTVAIPANSVSTLLESLLYTFQRSDDVVRRTLVKVFSLLLSEVSELEASRVSRLLLNMTPDVTNVSDIPSLIGQAWSARSGSCLTAEEVSSLIHLGVQAAASSSKDSRLSGYRLFNALVGTKAADLRRPPEDEVQKVTNCLCSSATSDPSLNTRAEATWTLANVVEARLSSEGIASRTERDQLLSTAIELASPSSSSRDAELIRTSALRILGSLATYPDHSLRIVDAIPCILSALQSASPKVQWNAAAVSRAMLTNIGNSPELVAGLVNAIEESSNVKVQTAIVNALMACQTPAVQEHRSTLVELQRKGLETGESVPFGEQARAAQLRALLNTLIERLDAIEPASI